jgi:hypothetical protein
VSNFITKSNTIESYFERQREMFKLVTFMQIKFKNRMLFREAKLECYMQYWDFKLRELNERVRKDKNYKMIELVNNIYAIPDEIKNYILKILLTNTQILSWIYFYTQRKIKSPDVCDPVEIDL